MGSNGRVLITGCAGMLGEAIYPYFQRRFPRMLATDKAPHADWCTLLDVRDEPSLQKTFTDFRPDLVLHLAAETDLEYCELNPEVAEATNVTAAQLVAQLTDAAGATLVYISTAGVFDGKKESLYTETDAPNPIMVYGDTKYRGEQMVRAHCPRHFVVRAGWMVGGGPGKDHKFVSKILGQVFAGKKTLHVVNDLWGTPTYTYDFAMNLCELLETQAYGTYHMVCEGTGTRFDVACELLRACGRADIEVIPVSSDYFKEEYFAPRPRSEMMANANLEKLGINRMRPWRDALHEYVRTHYAAKT